MTLSSNNLKIVLAALIAFGVASIAAAAVDVKLRDRATPRGTLVRLGDVAEISTADRQQARQLSALPLMPAPATGNDRFLRAREIQDMLSAQGVDIGMLRFCGAARVELVATPVGGPKTNVVQASAEEPAAAPTGRVNRHAAVLAGQPIEKQTPAPAAKKPVPLSEARVNEIRTQIQSSLADYLNAKAGKPQQWKVECDVADRDIAKIDRAQSNPTILGGTEPWTGKQRFVISFATAEGQIQVPLMAEVTPPPIAAVVAIRPIGRGEVVKAADIEVRMVDVTPRTLGQRAVTDSVEKLIGMEARQAMKAGDIVFTDSVQAAVMVRRGDLVTVSSQTGGIRVRTSGKAMHDAAIGELVQVEAQGSHEKYDARVTGRREAVVYALARPAVPESPKRMDTARRPAQLNLTPSR